MDAFDITHPFEPDLSFLYGTIFTSAAQHADCHSRNVCIFADGELDRSPTGSGVSARAALLHARGELQVGEKLIVESILGTRMSVQAAERVQFGSYEAVIPEVGGTAFITGRHQFYFDPEDPLRSGFILR
jgi:trans-L-3-hydroxyproline dehydratase